MLSVCLSACLSACLPVNLSVCKLKNVLGPGLGLSTILTALIGRYIFNYDWGWMPSLMFGCIMSATDPVAVVALLKDVGMTR